MIQYDHSRAVRQQVTTGLHRKIRRIHFDMRAVIGVRFDLQYLKAARGYISDTDGGRIPSLVGR